MSTQVTNTVATFSSFLDKLKPQLALALPKHMSPDRMARLCLTAFSSSSQLQACEPKSIAASLMTAGQLGLEPGVNGAGFLVPYGKTCTFVPGWKGLVDLVARSGRGTVYTGVIYRDQKYTFTDGAKRDLVIHDETDLDAPEDITHAYAVGWVVGAAMPIIELWRVAKIRAHRDKYNKVGTKHYSFRDWEMYARKVPLLQVLKYMPCSIEVSNAISVSHASEAGRSATIEHGIVIDLDDDAGREPENSGGRQTKQPYPDAIFDRDLKSFKSALQGGRSLDDVVTMASSRYQLSEEQVMAIGRAQKDAAGQSQEQAKNDAPTTSENAASTDDGPISEEGKHIEHKMNAAKTEEELNLASDLIRSVRYVKEKTRLGVIYQKNLARLKVS